MAKNILSFHYQDRGSNLIEIFIPHPYENFTHLSMVIQPSNHRKEIILQTEDPINIHEKALDN